MNAEPPRGHRRPDDTLFTFKQQGEAQVVLRDPAGRLHDVLTTAGGLTSSQASEFTDQILSNVTGNPVATEKMTEWFEAVVPVFGFEWEGIPSAHDLHSHGYAVDDMLELATRDGEKYRQCADRMLERGITSARVNELINLGFTGAPEPMIAIGGADDTSAAAWMDEINQTPELRLWVGDWAVVTALHAAGVTPSEAAQRAKTGIDPWLIAGRADLAAEYDQGSFAGVSGLRPELVSRYMSHNELHQDNLWEMVSAESAQMYGPLFEPVEVSVLVARKVEARAARSLRGAAKKLSVDGAARLIDAGVTTGADLKAWCKELGVTTNTISESDVDRIVSSATAAAAG